MLKRPESPTFYFVGVTTLKSSIMKIFPWWIRELEIPITQIVGYDVEVGGPAEKYRAIVRHIKENENAKGALVTTHKINIVQAAGHLFDYLDEYAKIFGEISSISKKNGELRGHAKDPISAGLALESFLPENHWVDNKGAQVFIMGAGGSGIALSAYLMRKQHEKNIPSKIIISNRSLGRLDHCKEVNERIGETTEVEYVQVGAHKTNDEVMADLPEGSLIVNATGMGKDRPGSPISDDVLFPPNSYVWEFNYRGSLEFLYQAEKQMKEQNLHVEDGWIYFIHGWTQVIGEAFNIDITQNDIERLSEIAKKARER